MSQAPLSDTLLSLCARWSNRGRRSRAASSPRSRLGDDGNGSCRPDKGSAAAAAATKAIPALAADRDVPDEAGGELDIAGNLGAKAAFTVYGADAVHRAALRAGRLDPVAAGCRRGK